MWYGNLLSSMWYGNLSGVGHEMLLASMLVCGMEI